MGQYSPPQLPNKPGHQVVHTQSVFPIECQCPDEATQDQEALSHSTCPSGRPGGNWDTCISWFWVQFTYGLTTGYNSAWFWVQLTYGVQIGYNSKAKKKEQEKITQFKKQPTPIRSSPLRFRVIRTHWKINYSRLPFLPVKGDFLFTLHEKNTVIVHWQDLASKSQKNLL